MKFINFIPICLFVCMVSWTFGRVFAAEPKQSVPASATTCALRLDVASTPDPEAQNYPVVSFAIINESHVLINVRYGGFQQITYHVSYVPDADTLAKGNWQPVASDALPQQTGVEPSGPIIKMAFPPGASDIVNAQLTSYSFSSPGYYRISASLNTVATAPSKSSPGGFEVIPLDLHSNSVVVQKTSSGFVRIRS